jgi:hypothetical protein
MAEPRQVHLRGRPRCGCVGSANAGGVQPLVSEAARLAAGAVCQDGQEDLPIPWELISAVFIGGSTSWKTSPAAEAICRARRATGKHVHVARVNGRERLEKVIEMGADSIDGSGISRYSHMRRKLTADSPKLFMERSCA